jgi:MoaA/NifB/PqqE/SkfB family radical SAM enzyme
MQLLIDKEFPIQINLELSRACNYDCPFCARKESEKGTHIDTDLAKRIIDEAGKSGRVTVFALHMWGEPLLNPKWHEIVSYIKEVNPDNGVTLTTNGYLLNQKNLERLVEISVDQIIISLHTLDPEEYKVRVGKDVDVAVVLENLKSLAKAASNKQVIIARLFDDEELRKPYVEQIEELRNLGIVIENDYYDNSAGQKSEWSKVSQTQRWPCYHPWLTTTITVHGEVSICCVDAKMDLKIGDVKSDTLTNIWQSDLVNQMRNEHLNNDFSSVCKVCDGCDTWSTKPDFFFNFQKNHKQQK